MEIDPDDAYALKGLGICLIALGRKKEGIELLEKAVAVSSGDHMDAYHDLAVVLSESEQYQQAIQVLERGRRRSEAFKAQSEVFYQHLMNRAGN